MSATVAAAGQPHPDDPPVRMETAASGPSHAVSLPETPSETFTPSATVILRSSPYKNIPEAQQRPELFDYGNPANARNRQEADDIAYMNRTIVRLMLDGMALHWALLVEPLPNDSYSQSLLNDLQSRGKAEWIVKWLPGVLKTASPDDGTATSRLVYDDYLEWHQDNGDGRPANRGASARRLSTITRSSPEPAARGWMDARSE